MNDSISNQISGISAYFETLKKEFVISWVRLNTYHTEREKAFFLRVLEGKKEKIKKIALKQGYIDPFKNPLAYEEMFNKNLRKQGAPHFTYRSDDERREMFKKDIYSYYSPEAIVRYYMGDDDWVEAKVISLDLPQRLIAIETNNNVRLEVDYRKVTRVFEIEA